MATFFQDLRFAFRGIRKQPSFASLAILTLALGIGASTTIFSVIYAILLDPFPYSNPERIVSVVIHDSADSGPGGRGAFELDEFLEYQSQSHVFSEAIGGGNEDVLYDNGEGTERFDGAYVTANTFRFLGVPALLGRTITEDDVRPGAPPVFVMSYKLWTTRFNRDAGIINRNFTLNDVSMTLIGVMPKRFTKRGADLWYGVSLDPADAQNAHRYFMFQARLKPDAAIQDARADLNVVAHNIARNHPKTYPKQFTMQVDTYIDGLIGQFRQTLYSLAAAVALLLLIACTNVANMMLARATAREKEMAVRSAMGATRWLLIRQLLTESIVLALAGAVLGCLFAWSGVAALAAAIPENAIPHEAVIRLNPQVLLFSLATADATSVLFGLAPALHAAKKDIVEPLKDAGKGVSGGFRHGRLRNSLVVLEVAMSLVLLAGAGLLMRTFIGLQTVDLGFNPNNILVARLPLPHGQYDTAERKTRFFETILRRIELLPGVVAVTETTSLPPYSGAQSEIEIAGMVHSDSWVAVYQLASEGYFRTLGLRVERGRIPDVAEVTSARHVAVVNRAMAKKFFGAQDPIGRTIRIKDLEEASGPGNPGPANANFEVIGIFADAKNRGPESAPMPEIVVPHSVTGRLERGILVRTSGDPNLLLNPVRKQIWAVDPHVAITLTGSLTEFLGRFSYAQPRFSLLVLGVFAGVGLILVAIGVYSVIAYTVSRQTHEIGIRMALGAARGHVIGMVFGMGFRLLLAGVVLGLLASLAATRIVAGQLVGVSAQDPLTLFAAVAVVLGVGAAACYSPANRATRMNAVVALRHE